MYVQMFIVYHAYVTPVSRWGWQKLTSIRYAPIAIKKTPAAAGGSSSDFEEEFLKPSL